jgi:hypothetical protein
MRPPFHMPLGQLNYGMRVLLGAIRDRMLFSPNLPCGQPDHRWLTANRSH